MEHASKSIFESYDFLPKSVSPDITNSRKQENSFKHPNSINSGPMAPKLVNEGAQSFKIEDQSKDLQGKVGCSFYRNVRTN
jgi:hypothetical protein